MAIYHYCSNATFHSIISNSTLRLSSLTQSNDSQEGIWALKVLKAACVERSRSKADQRFALWDVNEAMQHVESIYNGADGLGFCLSSDGDMLSQWRGYADDGHGVSIGFDVEKLAKWAANSKGRPRCQMFQIEYNEALAKERLGPLVDLIERHSHAGAFNNQTPSLLARAGLTDEQVEKNAAETRDKLRDFVSEVIRSILDEVFQYKHPAFREELEWRLFVPFLPGFSMVFSMHPTQKMLKPFRTFDLDSSDKSMIVHVTLGPKNLTPVKTMEAFLKSHQFNEAKVERSESSYQ
ncbi:DUF2971 domain-containing protein [Phyllobacterium sp. TAF24]|uniref:DUF2971 domain-containing protein n=1 Tax=Phyllobacterium sp. TAF24 TaxID=3233068 RepID=UPI003F96D534